jgi:hypothetical protein
VRGRCDTADMGGMDWDRERRERPRRERGSDPVDGPGGSSRPGPRPAPQKRVNSEIARLRANFAPLPREKQLAYLTDVRRSLFRLLRDDDAVGATIRNQFKPLLKRAGGHKPPGPPRPAARGSSFPSPRSDRDLSREALQLIRRRPDTMSQKQCVHELKASTCARRTTGEIKAAIVHLREQGTVVINKQGRLCPSWHDHGTSSQRLVPRSDSPRKQRR